MTKKSFEVYGDEMHLHQKKQYRVMAKDTNEAKRIVNQTHPYFVIELVYPTEFDPAPH